VHTISRLLPFTILFTVGCDSDSAPAVIAEPAKPATATRAFHPATCGTITGQVTWNGPAPVTPPFIYGVPRTDGGFEIRSIPNPNCPAIEEQAHGVAGAVVFLRGVDATAAKPWDLPPARIEMKDRGIQVVQGDHRRRVGFVRRGDSVEMRSAEPVYHVLRARGAAFFSLTFPEPDQPLSRTFDAPGRVHLTSGAGYYWANADLFVVEHPYCTVTDRNGRFQFDAVPAGRMEVTAWLPGWEPINQERDPESGLIFRQAYSPPLEISQTIHLAPAASAEAALVYPGIVKK
jgi:hypothetical protein